MDGYDEMSSCENSDELGKLNECAKCIDYCIRSLELAEQETGYSANKEFTIHNIPSNSSLRTSDALVSGPSNSSRSIRRQNITSRKKSSTVSKGKMTSTSKKVGKTEVGRSSKIVQCSRRKSNQSDQLESVTGKKLRKGYVYEVVPADVPKQSYLLDTNLLLRNGRVSPIFCERGTQTMGSAHFFAMLIEQLVNDQADMNAGSTRDMPITLPSYVSRRLLVTQQLLIQQSAELTKVCEENTRLHGVVNLLGSVTRKFRDEYGADLRRLRDSIEVLKRELSFYQEEFVAEAKKSVDNIQSMKEQFQRRMDDFEKKNRLLNARIELHIKEKEAAEELADGYLRDISARDRDVILANKARDKAERKLQDSLYVANNAKCAHCQISDKMRTHLTSVVAEKTILLEKCQKECSDLQRRADQADRISKILSKDGEKLRFELNTWKSDAERNASEISKLREELKKTAAGTSSNSVAMVQSHTRDKDGSATVKECVNSSSPVTRVGKTTPNDYVGTSPAVNALPDSTAREQVDGHALQTPVFSNVPSPLDETSVWMQKERRPNFSPSISLSPATSSSTRHAHPTTWRKIPFNGPFLNDHSISKLNAEAISPSSLIDDVRNNIHKNGNAPDDHVLQESWMPRAFSTDKVSSNGIQRRERCNRQKKKHDKDDACDVRDSRDSNYKNHTQQSRSPLAVKSVSRESRKRRPSESNRYDTIVDRIKPADQYDNRPRPFTGPIFNESCSIDDRMVSQYSSETRAGLRSRISSSPLPWHRVDSRDDSRNTWRVRDSTPSPPYQYDTVIYNGERHFHDRPVIQRSRRNYWEP